MVKFYSDVLGKSFDSLEEAETAEAEQIAKEEAARKEEEFQKARRKEAAKTVSDAYDDYKAAFQIYNEAAKAFCKEYGSITNKDFPQLDSKAFRSMFNIFDYLF